MTLEKRADRIRRRIIETAYKTQCGHVGSCLSCVEILAAIYFRMMKPGDHFVLSPGHKALALYATLVEKGLLKEIDLKKLGTHPKKNKHLGIEFSTGSLGHGLPLALGLAIADPKHITYVLLSDGDMDEGSTLEALRIKRELKINNLMVFVDANGWAAYQRKSFNLPLLASVIYLRGIKGKGLPEMENKLESHYKPVTKEMYEAYLCRDPV